MSTNDPYEDHPLTFTSYAGPDGPMAQVTIPGANAFWQGPAAELDRACNWWLTHRNDKDPGAPVQVFTKLPSTLMGITDFREWEKLATRLTIYPTYVELDIIGMRGPGQDDLVYSSTRQSVPGHNASSVASAEPCWDCIKGRHAICEGGACGCPMPFGIQCRRQPRFVDGAYVDPGESACADGMADTSETCEVHEPHNPPWMHTCLDGITDLNHPLSTDREHCGGCNPDGPSISRVRDYETQRLIDKAEYEGHKRGWEDRGERDAKVGGCGNPNAHGPHYFPEGTDEVELCTGILNWRDCDGDDLHEPVRCVLREAAEKKEQPGE